LVHQVLENPDGFARLQPPLVILYLDGIAEMTEHSDWGENFCTVS
jgi:hypothetical protein